MTTTKTSAKAGHAEWPWSRGARGWDIVDFDGRLIAVMASRDDDTANAALIARAPTLLSDNAALTAEVARLRAVLQSLVAVADVGVLNDLEGFGRTVRGARAALVQP